MDKDCQVLGRMRSPRALTGSDDELGATSALSIQVWSLLYTEKGGLSKMSFLSLTALNLKLPTCPSITSQRSTHNGMNRIGDIETQIHL